MISVILQKRHMKLIDYLWPTDAAGVRSAKNFHNDFSLHPFTFHSFAKCGKKPTTPSISIS